MSQMQLEVYHQNTSGVPPESQVRTYPAQHPPCVPPEILPVPTDSGQDFTGVDLHNLHGEDTVPYEFIAEREHTSQHKDISQDLSSHNVQSTLGHTPLHRSSHIKKPQLGYRAPNGILVSVDKQHTYVAIIMPYSSLS